MDSVVSNIERLVFDLYASNYDGSQNKSFNDANRLLTEAQNSKEAWSFVWLLLQTDKSENVQYFGASTLYVKISKHFFELDQECQTQVRQRIIEYLVSYLNYPDFTFITTKLISCLAVYVIHTIGSCWQTALEDIVNFIQPDKLPNLPSSRVIHILLQILNAIPEEFDNIYIDKTKKIIISAALQKQAESVLFIVHKVLSEDNISDTITQISSKCFSNWTKGLGTLILSDHHSSLMSIILNAVCNENTCHDAVEAIVDIYTSPYMEKYPKLILQLIEQMSLGLESVILRAFAELNHEYCKDIYFLFIQIGETYSRLLLDSLIESTVYHNVILKLLHIVLMCSSTPGCFGYDEFISEQSFNFWITFQDDIMGSDEGKIQTYLTLFNEIYNSLINSFLIKVQYPSAEIYENEWDNDDREKFRIYRQDIGDTFMYCYNILRVSMLKSLMNHFNIAIDQVKLASTQEVINTVSLTSSCRYLEAVYYAFSSIAENVDIKESIYLPQIFSSFTTISFDRLNAPRLLATIMNLLSSYAEWLCNNVNYIPYTILVIGTALKSNNSLVVVSATMALKTITPECQLNLQHCAPQIIALCEEHLSYSNLQYRDKARLMYTLGTVLSIMPMDVIMQVIDRILLPILTEADKIMQLDNNNNPEVTAHINGVLLILASLFSKLDVNLKETELEEGDELISHSQVLKSAKNSIKPQPICIIFEKVLPLFDMIASKYCDDTDIAESLCECIKKSVITLLDDFQPFVSNILMLLLHLYRKSQPICVLKISRQLFTLFYRLPDLLQQLQQYFVSCSQITLQVFENDFRENTYLVQVFYEECAAILKKASVIFVHPMINLLSVFNFAINGILLPEKPTIHQCAIFISEFLNRGRNNEMFNNVINERFDCLVKQVFSVIGGVYSSPNFAVDYMVDIIMALNQKYSDNFSRTLNSFVEASGFPTSTVTRDHKMTFVKTILTLRNNKRKLKEIVKEFSARCRGLYGFDDKQ